MSEQNDEFSKEIEQKNDIAEENGAGNPESAGEAMPKKESFLKKKTKSGKTVGHEIVSWVLTIAVAVAAALLIRTFIFEPVRVDGQSMCDTLQNGEIMFTTKYDYIFGDGPQVGDIVICNYPGRGNTKFVKRLIGLPGDSIKIVDHVVYRKAAGTDHFVALDEDYLTPSRNDGSHYANMSVVTLGEDEYFVMGDNRDNSNDSRAQGPITRDMILGHVRFVFFPFSAVRTVK